MNEDPNEVQLPAYVLVHPELTNDPANKQGEIGFITAAILNTDEFYIGFDDKEVGFYGADALLMLNESELIYDFIDQNFGKLSTQDFKDLKNIVLLQLQGTEKHTRAALELVQKNTNIRDAATMGLDSFLGLSQQKGLKR